ncbi:pectate lyase C [Venturia nashicola]|uniref:Pectate lyase C n=1 Tax=Venturia nashicola TaxID=86259 RepID=A0A4Z1NXN3_9PEZI|nr:pectate lyase C [Venturia nashicola]
MLLPPTQQLLFSLLLAVSRINGAQLAFPGAAGFGAYAKGGREGNNCIVSTLSDTGPGSLRDCLKEPNRIITFTVGGVIRSKERFVIPKSTTILGQTAPSPGITTYGNGWSASGADESIVRYIRVRMGKEGTKGKDAMGVAHGKNIIFDHVSVAWGKDETFSINGDEAMNITIMNCIIGQGLEDHSAGGLIQTKGGVSIFRNLYVDNKTRNPKVKGKNDFRNNVIYNWGAGGGYIAGGESEGESNVIIQGNYFIAGPSTGSTPPFVRGNERFHAFVSDNWLDGNKDGSLNGKLLAEGDAKAYGGMDLVTKDFGYPGPETIISAKEAVEVVLKEAGASNFRDAIDARMLEEVRSWGKLGQLVTRESDPPMVGLLEMGVVASRSVKEEKESLVDSDGDGIPDHVERERGWEVEKHDSMTVGDGGYTRLEEWANSLVGHGASSKI